MIINNNDSNQTLLPLGESVWVRRDHPDHGALFFLREARITLLLVLFTCVALFMSFRIITILFRNDNFPVWAAIAFCIFFALTYVYFARIVFLQACSLAACPIFFYAEQINPDQLTIHRLFKPQITIPLQGSLVSTTLRNRYINLTVMSKNRESETTLELLTPEEHDRFMQYWNAANPQASTEDQE